jgi:hypothetical protein
MLMRLCRIPDSNQMSNLGLAIFFDLVTVPVCCIALLKWGRLGHSSHALG